MGGGQARSKTGGRKHGGKAGPKGESTAKVTSRAGRSSPASVRKSSSKASAKKRSTMIPNKGARRAKLSGTAKSAKPPAESARRTVRPSPIVEPPPRLLPQSKSITAALAQLEKGIKLLYQKDFKKARLEFQSLIESYPGETEILARTRIYLQICEREETGRKKAAAPANDLYALGVMEHNQGNFDGAIAHFREALESRRDAEYIYYSLAASLALKGDSAEATQALRKAIELNEDNRVYAKNDSDFTSLHTNKEFADLVGMNQIVTGAPPLL